MEGVESFVLRKACTRCRQNHAACDGGHPCKRCVTAGAPDQCVFLPSRKRGRKPKPVVVAGQTAYRTHAQSLKQRRVEELRPVQPNAAGLVLGTRGVHDPHRYSTMQGAMRPEGLAQQSMTSSLQATATGSTDFDKNVLAMLIDQLMDMRQENKALHEGMRKMNSRYSKFKRRMEVIESENQRLFSLLTQRDESEMLMRRIPQGPFSQPLDTRSDQVSISPHLIALRRILPFLEEYSLWPAGVAVEDLSKPFAAFTVEDTDPEDDWPIFIYASPSYCALFGYKLEELIGRDFEPLCHPLDYATCSVVSYYATLGPATTLIGQVFNATPLMTTKDGRMLRTQGRYQYFYGNSGRVKWFINYIDRVIPEHELPSMDYRGSTISAISSSAALEPVSSLVDDSSSGTNSLASFTSSSVASSPVPASEFGAEWINPAEGQSDPQELGHNQQFGFSPSDDLDALLRALNSSTSDDRW